MLRSTPPAGAVLFMATAVAMSTAPDARAGTILFVTPGKAAYCTQITDYNNEGAYKLTCWTPKHGFTVSMYAWGRPTKRYVRTNRGRNPQLPADHVLRFGGAWSNGVFRCESERRGLICMNDFDHGWWLGRWVGYRIF